jgi:hypothetical protein
MALVMTQSQCTTQVFRLRGIMKTMRFAATYGRDANRLEVDPSFV